ncbi:MAG: TolC family protein [Ignavibacteriaceae bacterium]|jgi:outer membrane protein
MNLHKLLNRILPAVIIGLFVFSSIGFSQSKIYTLDDAIQTALNNNRDIKVAELDVEKSQDAVDEAFGYALPTLDLSANFNHFLKKPKTPFPDFEALLTNATYSILFDESVIPRDNSKYKPIQTQLQSFVQTNSYETSLTLTQTLFNSAVFRGIGASQIYLDLAKEELKRKVTSTVLDVKKAFYGVLLTKQLLEITTESYNNALENLKNVKALNTQGLVSDYDALQAEVRVENIKPVVLQIGNKLKDVKNSFKIVIGINQQEEIDVEGEFRYSKEEIPEIAETIEQSMQSNYSISSLKLKMQVDEAFIDLDRSEYWPSLYAFGNYTYAGSADNLKFQNYSSTVVGLTFSINLFNGERTKNKVQQSEISLKQTGEQLSQLKDYISTQVKAKIYELNRVRSSIDAQERNVNLAEKAYDISIVRYKEGTGNQLEVQNADMELKQARINRLQTVYDYIIAKSSLDEILGKVDPKYIDMLKIED